MLMEALSQSRDRYCTLSHFIHMWDVASFCSAAVCEESYCLPPFHPHCVTTSPMPGVWTTSYSVAMHKHFRFHNFFSISLNISKHTLPFISEITKKQPGRISLYLVQLVDCNCYQAVYSLELFSVPNSLMLFASLKLQDLCSPI